jgi:hypothetical protein
MRRTTILALVAVAALTMSSPILTGCHNNKGPAQKAGQKLDNAKEKVEDTVDPKGPSEKAGRKVDKALGK